MSPDEGCLLYSGFPKPVTASVRSTAAKGQVMPSSRAVGNVYPLDVTGNEHAERGGRHGHEQLDVMTSATSRDVR
jgi:hypothetical protein